MTYSKADQTKKKKTLKEKPCAYSKCDNTFIPHNMWHKTCNWKCAIDYQKETVAKHKLKENRKALKEFKDGDIPHLTKTAQQAFNKYIRKRDEDLPCISCKHKDGFVLIYNEEDELEYVPSNKATYRQRHAGHFRPVGRNHQMRFNENNAHSQCSICNNHLSGNLVPYREALIIKIGLDRTEALENDNTTKSYTVEELTDIIATYKQKYKDLG